ncbi:MAG TPA: hypothetical protein VF142_20350 [Longimicrobium sp.]
MSQTFTDDDLLTWEAFASGGRFGLSVRPRVVFNCVSDSSRPPRVVEVQGDEADAEELVHESGVDRLRQLLRESRELD